ncbi:MAG: hypothetical protein H0X51_06365 [Parachlamydiaceae bacterium]|nr:hypothetical protein [Parachlamydiaceae bacterium]
MTSESISFSSTRTFAVADTLLMERQWFRDRIKTRYELKMFLEKHPHCVAAALSRLDQSDLAAFQDNPDASESERPHSYLKRKIGKPIPLSPREPSYDHLLNVNKLVKDCFWACFEVINAKGDGGVRAVNEHSATCNLMKDEILDSLKAAIEPAKKAGKDLVEFTLEQKEFLFKDLLKENISQVTIDYIKYKHAYVARKELGWVAPKAEVVASVAAVALAKPEGEFKETKTT